MFRRLFLTLLLGFATLSASAQIAGHLGVPGTQMVYSSFGPIAGLPANQHYAGGAVSWPESGEIYLGDIDASQRSRPLHDQAPLMRYTMPAYENRLVLRASLAAGRAFSGYLVPN